MDNNYDVVIKSHQKDYYKLDLVVESLRYLNPQPENVYILSEDGFRPENTSYDDKIIVVRDDEVVPFIDRSKLNHRPNWNWVNLVSLFQTFTKNDLYFDVQSDNFFTQPLDLFDSSGRPKLFQSISNHCNNDGHRPYFEFSEKVFDIPKVGVGYSYIIEFMMYDRRLIKKMIEKYSSFSEMMEVIYNSINLNSYPADQEIFGNLIEKYFPEKYQIIENVKVMIRGMYQEGVDKEELIKLIDHYKDMKEYTAFSYHIWL